MHSQRLFGENYAKELIEKSPQLPQDIEWHFIGHLQSNKCKALLKAVPNLAMIESVDSLKLAQELQKACVTTQRTKDKPLRILVQVNTSGEDCEFDLLIVLRARVCVCVFERR